MTSTEDTSTRIATLSATLTGTVLTPGDPGYAEEIAAFNTAIVHTPDLVVAARSAEDVSAAVRFALEHDLSVSVQATGHTYAPVTSGLLISTRALDTVEVDAASGTARLGAGVRWGAVIAAAAEHGLAPVSGSSPTVGVVGYLLGGGIGPLARSHGFGSDYLLGATVVTGTGDLIEVDAEQHADLFWALRGGKKGLGVVVQVRLRLVELDRLYGGSLMFAAAEIEPALRGWADYTRTAEPEVTTSAALITFPDIEQVPAPMRGQKVLSVRFAYPGDPASGEELARPLRAAAPVFADDLGELAAGDIARIHNDPPVPGPGWVRGMTLERLDQETVSAVLAVAGPDGSHGDGLLTAVELRHFGSPGSAQDVEGGSAVGGRTGAFTLNVVGSRPDTFAEALPAAVDALLVSLAPWQASENTVNFIGEPRSAEHLATAWSTETNARLAEVRHRYDPDGVLH